ncbi:MAG: NUDIX domain-containing protein [Mariprofundaceae bacterium]|nr:NUDIX domain-containing protein [Mariprofundaceae bacterium]
MKFTLTDQKPLHRGFFRLDAYTVEHECFDGSTQIICREHLERGDAVAVLLFDPVRDEVLLIEQFRIGPAVRGDDAWLIEVVAGMIDEGEDAETAARREAVEEAGYEPRRLHHLARYYSTPGGSSERIDLFLGEVDRESPVAGGGGMRHEHEDIRVHWVTRERAMEWLHAGRIDSGAPMLALIMAFGCEGVVKGV